MGEMLPVPSLPAANNDRHFGGIDWDFLWWVPWVEWPVALPILPIPCLSITSLLTTGQRHVGNSKSFTTASPWQQQPQQQRVHRHNNCSSCQSNSAGPWQLLPWQHGIWTYCINKHTRHSVFFQQHSVITWLVLLNFRWDTVENKILMSLLHRYDNRAAANQISVDHNNISGNMKCETFSNQNFNIHFCIPTQERNIY